MTADYARELLRRQFLGPSCVYVLVCEMLGAREHVHADACASSPLLFVPTRSTRISL